MTVHPDDIGVHQDQILGFVESMVDNAIESDFRGLGGHIFNGSREYQNSYEFAARHKDENYDVFLLVRVRQQ